ncbi:hypothetical protein MNQ96_06700 [Sphingopyxis granuli]|uniref:hypothetical protein n=1 Tax=Sphingopyxis granuli TaxID=267128 RepID=UPI001F52E2D5|nr:hypothetical protein [Sphingopyxis granuli]UNK80756.1 hypothetical protein MNQ96_06700 [Sphingopyxis granuli]
MTPDAYLDFASCWVGADDQFTAFLILEQNRDGFRPHFVSSRCYVVEFGNDTTMAYLSSLMVAGDRSTLKDRARLTGDFLSNAVTDIGPPADEARVYLFRGALIKHAVEGYPDARIYDIMKVDRLIDTKMPFARFRRLTGEERFTLSRTLGRVR